MAGTSTPRQEGGGSPLRNRPVDLRMDIRVEDHNDGSAARYIVDFTITHVTE